MLEQVFYHLDIIEKDYFGLQYMDQHNVSHWLDPSKLVKKQNKIGPPYTFRMRIKFYSRCVIFANDFALLAFPSPIAPPMHVLVLFEPHMFVGGKTTKVTL